MSPCIYCGVTDPESRIAALTEELVEAYRLLELEKAKDGDTWKQRALDERAAREKAEKESAQYKLWWDETAKSHDATNAHLERAERERDAALARVKELEAALASARETLRVEREAHCDTAVQCEEWKKLYAKNAALRHIAESALASARELIERARAWLAWPTPAEPGPEPAACLLNALESWLSSNGGA